jgi:hypothetical protein
MLRKFMKQIFVIGLLVFSLYVAGQKKIEVTEQFVIEGLVKQPMTVQMNELRLYKEYTIDSIVITNHLLEKRSTLHDVKGVLLKDILSKVTLREDNPKLLSEFYFTCEASDGYKVVFSWNELFNSTVGNAVYIITSHDGKDMATLANRIALISPEDFATGRRYVKRLFKIMVNRAQ